MTLNDNKSAYFNWTSLARDWDIRINLGSDNPKAEALHFVTKCQQYVHDVKTTYLLVGGIEVGTNEKTSDYQKHHLHCALRCLNRVTALAVKEKLDLSKFQDGTSRNYYLALRPETYNNEGWRAHHIKPETKVDESECILWEYGSLPNNKRKAEGQLTKAEERAQENKKRIALFYAKWKNWDYDDEDMISKYGLSWIRMTSEFERSGIPRECPPPPEGNFPDGKNLWIYGPPRTGKDLYVKWKFPRNFWRDSTNYRFWNGFRPKYHTHIYYEDLTRQSFDKMGQDFWKPLLDPNSKYSGDIKFKNPIQNIRHPIIVTSNYHPGEMLSAMYGIEVEKNAIVKRFRVMHINELLREEGVKLNPDRVPNSKPEDCFVSLQ